MKEYILSVVCLIGIISFFSGCSTDPNEKANELYVEASQLMQSAKTVESYSEAFEIYNSALKNIQRIMSKYSTSTLAVQLVSGETKIEGLALSEFQKLEGHLKRLAEAEQNLLSCALFIAKTIETGKLNGKPVTLCGEYAAVSEAVPLLLGMGLRNFSMNPHLIAKVKKIIRILDIESCEKLYEEVKELHTASAIEQYCKDFFKSKVPDLKFLS